MRRVLSCLILIWFVAGCGSGSNNANAFVGTWTGTWTDATTTDSGTLAITIANAGHASLGSISGTVTNTTASTTAAVTGTINAGGQLNATYAYSGSPETESGIVVFGVNGALTGNLTETQGGAVVGTAAISLVK